MSVPPQAAMPAVMSMALQEISPFRKSERLPFFSTVSSVSSSMVVMTLSSGRNFRMAPSRTSGSMGLGI